MTDSFLFYLIDNERYVVDGSIRFAEGTGDDRTEWFLHILRHEKTGEICYLEPEGIYTIRVYWAPEKLLRATDHPFDAYKTCNADLLKGDKIFAESPITLEYGVLRDTQISEQAWGIFEGSTDVLVIDHKDILFGRRLVKDRDNVYFSNCFPAAGLERTAHPRRPPSASGEMLFLVAFAALFFTGIIDIFTLMKPMGPDFSSIFFYGGVVSWLSWRFVDRTSWLYATSRVWAAAFGLYLCTMLFDNHAYVAHRPHFRVLELWHMLACLALVGGLRLFWRKGFATLSQSAFIAAFWAFILHVAAMLLFSSIGDDWWGSDFFWYMGAPPFGHAYTLLFLVILLLKARDYLYVPMEKKDFVEQIHKLQAILQRSPSTDAAQNKKDAEICDDLADAIEISSTPEVASLAPLLEQFRTLTTLIETYPNKHKEIDKSPLVSDDLKILSADLQEIVDQLDTQQPVHSLRLSPFLRAVALEAPVAS